jgi:hypothetical protein
MAHCRRIKLLSAQKDEFGGSAKSIRGTCGKRLSETEHEGDNAALTVARVEQRLSTESYSTDIRQIYSTGICYLLILAVQTLAPG